LPKEERYVKKRDKEEDEDEEEGGRPSKRPRSNKTTSKESEGDKPARDNQLGSLIGRKRREKKSKGKANWIPCMFIHLIFGFYHILLPIGSLP